MQPTVLKQEFVMLDPSAYRSRPPKRGELVAIGEPGQRRIKRVIGLPGDRVEVSDGALLIDGWEAPRCEVGLVTWSATRAGTFYLEFLGDSTYLTFWMRTTETAPRVWVAGPGEAVLLNDDRNNSDELHTRFASDDYGVPFARFEGRPTFLFLGLTYAEDYVWPRYGSALDAPRLPSDLKALDEAFHKCLELRPPRALTEPH